MSRSAAFKAVVVLILIAAVAAFALVWKPAIAAIEPPARTQFPEALVKRGAELAAIGYCAVCHSVPGNGKAFAGSRPMATPFGTIYSTNITPDAETGIGRWSEAAFQRAMHEGVARDGRHLYPAFPYDHFTNVTDEDNRALYAFLMTRDPVRETAPANVLPFPLNFRPLLAGWKLLFLRKGPMNDDGSDAGHGRYLVEGLAHCGGCHTPRNSLGAETKSSAYAGGSSEGWDAPALTTQNPAPVPWTAEHLLTYLRSGWHEQHGASAGPMQPVTNNLGKVPEADVRAIAVYIASFSAGRTAGAPPKTDAGDTTSAAATIYAGACSVCHDQHDISKALPLTLSSALREPRPRNAINFMLHGIVRPEGQAGPYMPSFEGMLNDQQIAALAGYLRTRFTAEPAWTNIESEIAKIRKGEEP